MAAMGLFPDGATAAGEVACSISVASDNDKTSLTSTQVPNRVLDLAVAKQYLDGSQVTCGV